MTFHAHLKGQMRNEGLCLRHIQEEMRQIYCINEIVPVQFLTSSKDDLWGAQDAVVGWGLHPVFSAFI